MDPEVLKAAIQAIKDGDGDAALALLEKLLTGAGEPGAADPAEGDPASATGEPAATPPVDPAAQLPAANAADAPATAMLLRITGARNLAEAEPILASAIRSTRSLEADRQAVTMNARRELIVELIQVGGETPATAWEGKPEDRKPAEHLASMPLEKMRTRVTALKARNGVGASHTPLAGESDVASEVARLSPDTLKAIAAKGMTPEQFVAERSKATRRVGSAQQPTG